MFLENFINYHLEKPDIFTNFFYHYINLIKFNIKSFFPVNLISRTCILFLICVGSVTFSISSFIVAWY
jgi:hypothetical protein